MTGHLFVSFLLLNASMTSPFKLCTRNLLIKARFRERKLSYPFEKFFRTYLLLLPNN